MDDYKSDEDEDLKLAIAMSLQDQGNPAASAPDHDATLATTGDDPSSNKAHSSFSNEESKVQLTDDESRSIPVITVPSISHVSTGQQITSILGLDRRRMEEERLARLAQRKRTLDDGSTNQADEATKRQKLGTSSISKSVLTETAGDASATSKLHQASSPKALKYSKGAILKTASPKHPRNRDITIAEVLQKDDLLLAVISSFMWDFDWLISKLDMRRTKLVMCMAAKTEEQRRQYSDEAKEAGRGRIRCCFPPMEGETQNMHSKLMLLAYEHSMRIVVPSANAVPYDWGETGIMENTVFVIDLPRLNNAEEPQNQNSLTSFGKELLYFLDKSKMPDFVKEGMLKFDFAATEHLAFVHSVGGANFGSDMQRTGFNSLARSIRELGLASQTDLHLDVAASSIGALTDSMLNSLHNAAKGKTTLDNTRTKSQLGNTKVRDFFSVYFPTLDTVKESIGGIESGGTICIREEWFTKPTFPSDVMRDYKSTRKGLLSHNKILLAHNKTVAWVYVGSANLSESAWGKVVNDSKRKENKLVCRNWECGVLIPVAGGVLGDDETSAQSLERDVDIRKLFDSVIDIPFDIPSNEYGTKKPWYFLAPHWN